MPPGCTFDYWPGRPRKWNAAGLPATLRLSKERPAPALPLPLHWIPTEGNAIGRYALAPCCVTTQIVNPCPSAGSTPASKVGKGGLTSNCTALEFITLKVYSGNFV